MPAPLCCVEKEFQAFRHRLSAHVLKDPVKVFCNSRCEDHALSQDLVTITLLRRSKAIPYLFARVRSSNSFWGSHLIWFRFNFEPRVLQKYCVESFQGGFSHSFKGPKKKKTRPHFQERQHLEGDQSLGRGSFSNQFPQLTSFVSTIASLPLSSLHLVSSFMRCRPRTSKK